MHSQAIEPEDQQRLLPAADDIPEEKPANMYDMVGRRAEVREQGQSGTAGKAPSSVGPPQSSSGGSSAAESRTIDELGSQGAMAGFFSSFEGEGGTGVEWRMEAVEARQWRRGTHPEPLEQQPDGGFYQVNTLGTHAQCPRSPISTQHSMHSVASALCVCCRST